MGRVEIAFVWHMHQPWYLWPDSSQAALPFARLHATGAYYDMPWLLERFEDTRVTFNLVPSLIEQVRGYARGEITDRALTLSLRAPEDLTLDDQRYLLTHMCGGHPGSVMAASPRYAELLHKRGPGRNPETIDRACRLFEHDEYRDLQVLFNLAWCGFALEHDSEVVASLREKGEGFTEDEKAALIEEMQDAVTRVVELYDGAAEEGRAELICSPFYHPIMPLLAKMEDAERRIDASQLPDTRWREPEEARRQLRRGLQEHQEIFAEQPRGIWPSEGSISEAALEIVADEGVSWAASDEEVLAASLGASERPTPDALYGPWLTPDGRMSLVFRDHRLSDLIGFVYRDWDAGDAADDFVRRLRAVGDDGGDGEAPPLVSVILDGENPWGWYADAGEGFLTALYEAIEADDELQTTTVSDYLDRFGVERRLDEVFPGSWIDHSFSTWIGGDEHRRAWELLTGALEVVREHEEEDGRVEEARTSLMIAEGSDWFWWYSENQHTLDADIFDALFRAHVAHVYRALGEEPPDEVEEPIYAEKISRLTREAVGRMQAQIDGRITNYFEWRAAALLRTSGLASAMQRSEYLVHEMYFGFDERDLWLRIDTDGPAATRLRGCRLEVVFSNEPEHVLAFSVPDSGGPEMEGDLSSEADCALRRIVEARMPLEALEVEAGENLRLAVVVGREGHVVERWPELGFLQVRVPTAEAMASSWVI